MSYAFGLRTGDDQIMGMIASVVADLNEALNEATVAELRLRSDGSVAVLLCEPGCTPASPAPVGPCNMSYDLAVRDGA